MTEFATPLCRPGALSCAACRNECIMVPLRHGGTTVMELAVCAVCWAFNGCTRNHATGRPWALPDGMSHSLLREACKQRFFYVVKDVDGDWRLDLGAGRMKPPTDYKLKAVPDDFFAEE